MSDGEAQWVDIALSRLLRGGVLISIAVVMTGMVVTFVHHPDYFSSRPALGLRVEAGVVGSAPRPALVPAVA